MSTEHLFNEHKLNVTRRYFFKAGSHALGWAALNSMMHGKSQAATVEEGSGLNHFAPKAKKCDLPAHGGWPRPDGPV